MIQILKLIAFPSIAFFTWAHGPCIACLYPDILSRCFIARPVLEQRKDLLGYILG